ncbi:actin-related protein 10-like isoform X1 [Patiria miniata]|uniref:Actin-related protein 10 n=1 Tax=Patiria miniata TaxID=46514 RepID=A0A914AT84_PATMI|nr:actin-related protein 10-like isoform X1 [Patiria miniata]
MSFFEGLGSAVEKTTVVLDIGAAYTKIGFANETGPRAIIASSVKQPRSGTLVKVWDFSNSEELYDVLVDFLHVVYFRHLLVNPRDRRLVIVESVLCPSQFRETLARVLFKHYEVPSILFAPSHLLALFTLGVDTALVLDSGYSETIVLPVYEGVPIIKGVQALPLGASAIHSNLQVRLLEEGVVKGEGNGERPLSSVMSTIPEETLEDIKVRTCFVTNMDRIQLIQHSILQSDPSKRPAPPAAVEYPLDGGKILTISGDIRETACEVLFDQDNEETSVATLILDSILKCPIDMRRTLASNLVTVGGTSMLQGFNHRLLAELRELLQKPRYKEELAVGKFKIHDPPSQANYTAWLGGAIFGALEILSYRSLTKDAYLKFGRVPDWCSLDQTPLEVDPLSKDKTPRRLFRDSMDRQGSIDK